MKRMVLFILVLVLLVDLAEDGYLGNVKTGPLVASVSVAFSIFPHHPTRQVDYSHSLPSTDFPEIFGQRQSQPIKPKGQLALKLITTCNIGSSGGIPDKKPSSELT